MQPIRKEYIQFLSSHNVDTSWYLEDTFWLDNQIIKVFDTKGNQHKIYRVYISDNSEHIELKKLKSYTSIQELGANNVAKLRFNDKFLQF